MVKVRADKQAVRFQIFQKQTMYSGDIHQKAVIKQSRLQGLQVYSPAQRIRETRGGGKPIQPENPPNRAPRGRLLGAPLPPHRLILGPASFPLSLDQERPAPSEEWPRRSLVRMRDGVTSWRRRRGALLPISAAPRARLSAGSVSWRLRPRWRPRVPRGSGCSKKKT